MATLNVVHCVYQACFLLRLLGVEASITVDWPNPISVWICLIVGPCTGQFTKVVKKDYNNIIPKLTIKDGFLYPLAAANDYITAHLNFYNLPH